MIFFILHVTLSYVMGVVHTRRKPQGGPSAIMSAVQGTAVAKGFINDAMTIADEIRDVAGLPEGLYLRLANKLKAIFEHVVNPSKNAESNARKFLIEMMVRNPGVLHTIDHETVERMFRHATDGPFTSRFIKDLYIARFTYQDRFSLGHEELNEFNVGVANAYLSDARMTAPECKRPVVGRELTAVDYQCFASVRSIIFKLAKGESLASQEYYEDLLLRCSEELCRAIISRLEKFAVAPDVLYPRFFYAFRSMDEYMFVRMGALDPLGCRNLATSDTKRCLHDMLDVCWTFGVWICNNMHRNVHRMSWDQKQWVKTTVYKHLAQRVNPCLDIVNSELRHNVVQYMLSNGIEPKLRSVECVELKKFRIRASVHPTLNRVSITLQRQAVKHERFRVFEDGSCENLERDDHYDPFMAEHATPEYVGWHPDHWKEKELRMVYKDHSRVVKALNGYYITVGEMLDAAFLLFEDSCSLVNEDFSRVKEVVYVLMDIKYTHTAERRYYTCQWEPQAKVRVNKKRPLGDDCCGTLERIKR